MNSFQRSVRFFITALWLVVTAPSLFGCAASPSANVSRPPIVKPAPQSLTDFPVIRAPFADTPTPVPPTPAPPTVTPVPPTPAPPTSVPAKPTTTLAEAIGKSINPAVEPPQPFVQSDLYIHLPPQASQKQPLRVMLVLHGMGAKGESFAKALSNETDRYNWVIVAPNLPYRDYMEPKALMEDDLKITKMLADTLDALPAQLNLTLRPRTLVYGFSRGAQLGHRFALMYPDRVDSVATLSAGTYTLPVENKPTDKGAQLVPFPFGIGDLDKYLGRRFDWVNFKKVSFWVAVGEKDNDVKQVPRQFDPYLGNNRVERARAFEQSLRALGIDVQLMIYPNAGHEVTGEMRRGATQFLNDCDRKENPATPR